MKMLFCGLVTSLLTIGQLMLSSSAAPSVANFINKQGSFVGLTCAAYNDVHVADFVTTYIVIG